MRESFCACGSCSSGNGSTGVRGFQRLRAGKRHQFQRRWLLQHQCSKCQRGILGVDGHAKVRTKLRANADAGVWDCNRLNAHCLTGCQSTPIPGRKYCAIHLQNADPLFDCDLNLQLILSFLATKATVLSRTEDGRHKSPDIVALFPLCRRTRKALHFAVSHAKLQYLVSLLSVKRIPLLRRYAFQTLTGQTFSLSSALVPTHYQQQYGQSVNPCWSPFHESANQSHASDIKSSSLHPRKITHVDGSGKSLVHFCAGGRLSRCQGMPSHQRHQARVHPRISNRGLLFLG